MLEDIFAATIGGYSELRKRSSITSGDILLVDESAGVLLKTFPSGVLSGRLHTIQWGFVGMVLTEWKAVIEHWLKDFVAEYLNRTSGRNPTVEKKIFKSSANWKDEIFATTGIDISAKSRLGWVLTREFIEIRNCLVHRGQVVDQEFLNRLADIQSLLTYKYVIGRPFNLSPGEVYQLLDATEDFITKTAAELP